MQRSTHVGHNCYIGTLAKFKPLCSIRRKGLLLSSKANSEVEPRSRNLGVEDKVEGDWLLWQALDLVYSLSSFLDTVDGIIAVDRNICSLLEEVPKVPEKKIGWSFFPKEEGPDYNWDNVLNGDEDDESDTRVRYELISPSTSGDEQLPEVSQTQILAACTTISLTIAAMGYLLRGLAAKSPELMGTSQSLVDTLLNMEPHLQIDDILVVLGAATLVTTARKSLMSVWSEFAIATNRSNRQVLPGLDAFAIFIVSFLPGISEEFFFRSAMIPALYPDWRGVIIAGVAFGMLHNTGGKNWAFSLWASSIGVVYGFAFLTTQNMYVPMLAHSLTNLSSSYLWLNENSDMGDHGQQ